MKFIITVFGLHRGEIGVDKTQEFLGSLKQVISATLSTIPKENLPGLDVSLIIVHSQIVATSSAESNHEDLLIRVEQVGGGMRWYPDNIKKKVQSIAEHHFPKRVEVL